MWFGTEDGLNRYDGYEFKIFRSESNNPGSISDNFIRVLFEDKNGDFWIGTNDGGLHKYNFASESFSQFLYDIDKTGGLGHNSIRAIEEDNAGNLWIGTWGGGVKIFNRQKQNFVSFKQVKQDTAFQCGNFIRAIFKDSKNRIWIGTDFKGINKYNPADKSLKNYLPYINNTGDKIYNSIVSAYEDREGTIWLGGAFGLYFYDQPQDKIRKIDVKDPHLKSLLNNNSVQKFIPLKENLLLLATTEGLLLLNPRSKEILPFQNNSVILKSFLGKNIFDLVKDDTGINWIGSAQNGVLYFSDIPKKFKHIVHDPEEKNSLSANTIRSVFEDSHGYLWIGTVNGGLNVVDPQLKIFRHYLHKNSDPGSISDNTITKIYEDQNGILWIGTWNGGLNQVVFQDERERTIRKFIHYLPVKGNSSSLSSQTVTDIFEDSRGRMWIGTSSGLELFDRHDGKFIHYQHNIHNKYSISEDQIQSNTILEDQQGNIWLGTWNGLNRIVFRETQINGTDPVEKFIKYFHDPGDNNSLNNNRIISIYEDHQGIIWIGTYGGGLNKLKINYAENGDQHSVQLTHYTQKDGLPNNNIYCILNDNMGNLWLSTNNGLSRFSPEQGQFKNYEEADGLQSNQFYWGAGSRGNNGRLFFGGINGLNLFSPDQITDNPIIPKVHLTGFSIFNNDIEIGEKFNNKVIIRSSIILQDKIELSYKENMIAFYFVALNYILPEKNSFQIQMEGLSEKWQALGHRNYISFNGIAPGEYQLNIQAANNDGLWNKNSRSVKIIIHPPFWKTIWFNIFLFFLFSILLVFVYKWRMRILKHQKVELERQIKLRTEEVLQQKKVIEEKLEQVQQLSGLLPICSNCKVIRDDKGYWHNVENYISEHSSAEFSHSICPDCMKKLYPDISKKISKGDTKTEATDTDESVKP